MAVIQKKAFCWILRLSWFLLHVFYTAKPINGQQTIVDENNEFQEFVQIQSKNGSLLCGGVIINSEFIATATACLNDNHTEHHIKEIGSNGLKIIINEYSNSNGLTLINVVNNYPTKMLQMASDQPRFQDKCKLLGWDADSEGKPYQLANEISYTPNFLDEIRTLQINNPCEQLSVEAMICNNQLQSFIVRNCVNKQAEYTQIDIPSQKEWIQNIFNCVLNNSEPCLTPQKENDYEIQATTVHDVYLEEHSTEILPATESETTTTTPYTTPIHLTTVVADRNIYTHQPDESNSIKLQPIFFILFINFILLRLI